jgi:hypothetical protein
MRTLIFLAAAAAVPATALADTAPATTAPAPATTLTTTLTVAIDNLSPVERDALAAADALAAEAAQAMEAWVTTQAVTEPKLFARMYFPVAGTDPLKYTTAYDTLADHDLTPLEDKALLKSQAFQYAFVCDANGYIPAHNTRYSQRSNGNKAQDAANNRTKRIFGDSATLQATHSDARFLDQRVRLETGDVIGEISVPLVVRGKRWGSVRVGFRRND